MSNGQVCCILAVCCDPGSAKQVAALNRAMRADLGDEATAEDALRWVAEKFDLAPFGALSELKAAVASGARGAQP